MLDALGNPIIIGGKYGYSHTDNGWGRVIVGTVVRYNKKVTLNVISRTDFLYGVKTERDWGNDAVHVSVQPFHLFPVA